MSMQPMSAEVPKLATIGEIAARAGVPTHRAEYLVRRWLIRPIGVAGGRFVYGEDDAARLVEELKQVTARRATGMS